MKCLLHKFILDGTTLTKLNKLLGHMKGLLVRNNDKTIRKICGYANPYFYYKMKYGKNPELYQKKIEGAFVCERKERINLKKIKRTRVAYYKSTQVDYRCDSGE